MNASTASSAARLIKMGSEVVGQGGIPGSSDAVSHARDFRYWQSRILISALVGYALFYFVRKNISVAAPVMYDSLGITKRDFGLFLTLHGLVYGISKFINGVLGDRVNARWFMPLGLASCAAINIWFGFSSSLVLLGVLWMLNGWFQGVGFPPCAKLMTHWFSPREFATKMAIWNSSHSIGAGLIYIMCGYLAPIDWRLAFFVPGGIALLGAVGLSYTLRDTPESLGFPPVEGTDHIRRDEEPVGETLSRFVFSNPYIWLLSLANFFVYAVRYGILDWGPTFLKESRHIDLSRATWIVAAYELAGLFGMLCGGWLTDRMFGGRAARACFFYMIGCTVALVLFWQLPNQSTWTCTILMCFAGFFIYGPQSLIGTACAKLATKRAAAAAVGLTSVFGYLSTTLSGIGVGALVEKYNWDAGFAVFVVCSLVGVLLFAVCWPAKADGYAEGSQTPS
jgi:OPA family glycerol-3-phosphate transporter-like MFS transporter/OPA family sugar phosphate sensor protein UhpC-like MFS transporter